MILAHYIDQAAQERAEAKFNKQEEKRRDAEVAMAAYLEEQRAIEEKTARLRAARLAREEQEKAKREAGASGKAPGDKSSGVTTANGKIDTASARANVKAAAGNGRDMQVDIKAQAAAFAAATKRANAAKAKLGIKGKPAARAKTVAAKKKLSA
jgi:hypothetical protein